MYIFFNRKMLVLLKLHYIENNPEMVSSKKKIYIFSCRKTDMNILNYMGVSKLSGHFYSGSEIIL